MISTHVLDTSRGLPAAGMLVVLERLATYGPSLTGELSRARTDAEGRVRNLLPSNASFEAGRYRLTFDTGSYFASCGLEAFYPAVIVTFSVKDPSHHVHLPLLLSPYGYSTYRGS